MTATITKSRPTSIRPASIRPTVNNEKPHASFDFDDDELEPAIAELRPACLKQRSDTLLWYRSLGKLVAKHYVRVEREREKSNDTMYGEHFFNKLAEAIQVVSAATLRACFNLFYYYPDAAFRELVQQKAITPTHALRLALIESDAIRHALQKQVVEDNLTVKDLERVIKKCQPKPRKRGAGRPFKVPSSLTKALSHLSEQSTAYRRAHEKIWFGEQFNIAEKVPDLPSSVLSATLRGQLEEALEGCESLASVAEAEAEELRNVIALVDKRLAAQAEYDRKARANE